MGCQLNRLSLRPGFLIALLLLSAISCADDSSGGAEDQTQLDQAVIYGVITGVRDMYNLNLAGASAGSQNVDSKCSLGGEVAITGTASTSGSNGITTVDLTYAMKGCRFNVTKASGDGTLKVTLTLTGSLTYKGSFGSNNYESTNFQSDDLEMTGTVTRADSTESSVEQSCPFAASMSLDGGQGSVSGAICGRETSWGG